MTQNNTDTSSSLYDILSYVTENQPDKAALNYYGREMTYKQLKEFIDVTALAFKRQGIKEGDIVCIPLPTTPESIACFYALNRIGAVSCMFDLRYSPDQICEIVDRTQAKMLFIMDFTGKALAKADEKLHVEKVVMLFGGDSFSVATAFHNFSEWFNGQRKLFQRHQHFCHWKDFIGKTRKPDTTSPHRWAANEIAALFHTSGTTGTVKTVMLSTENLYHSVFHEPFVLNDSCSDDTVLCFMPIFVSYGARSLAIALSHGMRVVAIPRLTSKNFLKTIAKHKPQHIFTSPASWDAITLKKNFKHDFSHLKSIIISGDMLTPTFEKSINDFLHERNCRYDITKAYGMTEIGGVTFTPQGCDKRYVPGFSGMPKPLYEIKIHDGEICVRPKMHIPGYYKNEKATRTLIQTHPDGSQWVHTGDMGYLDEEGYLFVVGRKKRMIVKYDGSKIFPVEIEDCLAKHPMVHSCAVVPMQDPDHSESQLPRAFVVLKDPNKNHSDTVVELMRHCKKNLPDYLVPETIEIITTMPINSSGKVDYKKLIKD